MSRRAEESSEVEESQEKSQSLDFDEALDQLQEMFPELPRARLAQRLVETSKILFN